MERLNGAEDMEHTLGFEIECMFPEGLPSERVRMIQTKNTRKTNRIIEEGIARCWQEKRQVGMFDGDRARFEGIRYRKKSNKLNIFFSHEKYKTYFYTGNTTLPKSHQAQPFSMNGIVIARDNVIPVGLRKAETTNQGRIWHVVPAGYVDLKPTSHRGKAEQWYCETPHAAAERELHEELAIPKGGLDRSKMRLTGIVFNYDRYYDTTASIVIPVECDSSEIKLRGDEHERIRFVRASLNDLKEELIQLSQDPIASSGHLRGDILLTIAYLYGYSECIKTLRSATENL